MPDQIIYPTGLGLKDLLAYGKTGMVLLDSSTDTVVKASMDGEWSDEMTRERQIYERFVQRDGHKNILLYHGTFGTGIPLEYTPYGNIRSYLDEHPTNKKRKIRWALQIAEALDFVHQCGVIHGDVDGSNGFNADIFALGSTLYEVMNESRPYAGLSDKNILERYTKGRFPETESLGIVGSIITKCWRGEYGDCKLVVHDLKGEPRYSDLYLVGMSP
ncbi:hypothetical protein N658DRAFT_460472 [Parathielavia hyrcaniae]|uniref:Protein kinase domain-containing protein n=1 Tax=Parathielavia hyrcaniae TaxID=113614 RepID=A0AAN6Q9P2_9PEZI|nr:hypothetical protein N658DRAFT_460472 [Parathielavia hyrcaniae]